MVHHPRRRHRHGLQHPDRHPKVTYAALIGDYIDGTGNVFTGNSIKGITTNGTLAQSVFKLSAKYGRIGWSKALGFNVNSLTATGVDYTKYGYLAHVWYVQGTHPTVVSNTYVDSTVIKTLGAGATLLGDSGYCNTSSDNFVAVMDANVNAVNSNPAIEVIGTSKEAAGTNVMSQVLVSNVVAGTAKANVKGVAVSLLDEDGDGRVDAVSYLQKTVFTMTSAPVTKTENGVDYVKIVGITGDYVKAAMVDGYKDLAAGDVVLWFIDCTGTYHIAKAASFAGTYSAAKTANGVVSYTIGSNPYQVSGLRALYFANGATPTYTGAENTYYTDDFGYLVAEKADTTDYTVYVFAYYYNVVSGQTASVMYADGTTAIIPVSAMTGFTNQAAINASNNATNGYAGTRVNEWAKYSKTSSTLYALNGTEANIGATVVDTFSPDVETTTTAGVDYYTISNDATHFLVRTVTDNNSTQLRNHQQWRDPLCQCCHQDLCSAVR
jgi:hypothetical protein